MNGISVKNINKSYDGAPVLENFSAFFEYGKCTAIMGENGCGKTTLLNILMGLDKDFSGNVEGMPERFSVVFQENRLCEEFSVFENVRMAIKANSSKPGNQFYTKNSPSDFRVNEILCELGLEEYAKRKVSELSGGQKRRVAIARALCFDAGLIIMDEPFKELDEENKKAAARAVLSQKETIILVTHDIEDVELMNATLLKM